MFTFNSRSMIPLELLDVIVSYVVADYIDHAIFVHRSPWNAVLDAYDRSDDAPFGGDVRAYMAGVWYLPKDCWTVENVKDKAGDGYLGGSTALFYRYWDPDGAEVSVSGDLEPSHTVQNFEIWSATDNAERLVENYVVPLLSVSRAFRATTLRTLRIALGVKVQHDGT